MRVLFPVSSGSAFCLFGRLSLGLALGLGLSACGAPPPSVADQVSFGDVKASFIPGQSTQFLQVNALGVQPMRSAVLVEPDGKRVPAPSIDVTRNPQPVNTAALGGIGAMGGADAFAGASGVFPTGVMPSYSVQSVGQFASMALIDAPDPVTYQAIWQKSKVEIVLGDGPAAEHLTLDAPAPLK